MGLYYVLDCLYIQNGYSVLQYYQGNYVEALVQNFPQLRLDATKFSIPSIILTFSYCALLTFDTGSYWLEKANQKWFFEKFAEKWKFNPLVPQNWYSITLPAINAQQVHSSLHSLLLLKFLPREPQPFFNCFPIIG